jgi:diguanylate cyclase (GGDEF)-like protein/PAS domain S-box-containing protein
MKPANILIVEDEFILASDLRLRLRDLGYAVAGAVATGADAVALADRCRPDLVLMDIRLQGPMDGIAAAQEIRHHWRLPVVFLTAHGDDDTLQRAKLAEPFGYILKPFEDRELRTLIEIALYKHRAAEEIRRLSNLYATLSQINQAIVRIDNRQALLDEVCRVTAGYGGFLLVWIGWIDPQTQQIHPVAQAGAAVAYLDGIVVYADDRPEGCGLVGTCLREGHPCIFNNLLDDPRSAPWRERARQYGLQAAVAIPIRFQDAVCAAFAVYAATPDVFQAQEMNLLEEAASDISFALDHQETERHRQFAEEKLRESEFRLKSIFRALPAGIGLVRRRVILEVNDHICQMTGYARQELLGQSARLFYLNDQDYEWVGQEKYRQIAEKGTGSVEVRWHRKDGEVIWVFLSSTPLDVADLDKGVTFTAFDITDRRRAEERITHLTYYDALTQLPNRVLLTDRLQQAMAQTQRDQQKLAVCYLDLDDFKPINDALGPSEGDRVLVEVAHRLKACVRAGDTVARLGGDEFVLLLGDLANVEECERALDRVLTVLHTPLAVAAGPSLALTASLGVTLYPDDAADPDALLRHTDQAMYAAKQAGGHRYHWFDADHDRRARAHRELLQRVEVGLAAGEFRLYYQPKVEMHTGTVIGAEALIRWQHPDEGLLPPARFMPAVETSELVTVVDCWVIQEALRQMTVWAAQGLNLPVSVNVCGRHLQQPDFVARLQTVLARYPTTPRDGLELEILETAALDDMEAISRLIEACRQFGVRFALDDFGTGYSSLTYLQHLPVQILKIDQSFVRNLLVDTNARAIVEGVIGLSAAFRREVIAEGVETDAQGCRLIQLGCTLAQGYGIARPMPPEQIPAWIASWTPPDVWADPDAPA